MKISVVIPVFNALPFLEDSIKSLLKLNQIFEIILVDDNSKDNSFQKCLEWEQSIKIIRTIKNESNINGPAVARNIGLRIAKGDFIAFLDADDYFLPTRFKSDEKLFYEFERKYPRFVQCL